jgi:hypothetical protein
MHDLPSCEGDDMHDPGKHPRAPRRAAILAAAALLATACGGGPSGPRVAGDGTATPGAATSGGSTKASALAYSKCMRSHGVANFPDPDGNGHITIRGTTDNGLGPDAPQMQSAMQACRSLEPRPSEAQQQEQYSKAVAFAHCMRSHGVTNLPDPQPPGTGPQTQSHKQGDPTPEPGPDPNSPEFKKALQACRKLLPGGAEFSTGTSVGP